ncbi:MAG TPA: HK97 family phage prohead protease, partial [Stellaceae bacterium]|nr:HK97 family phage prohead protease [Stellaceae bacterium]
CELDHYRANPIVLWQHDPDFPVGRASTLQVSSDDISARITFAPSGISAKADEVRGLVKSGIVSSVSVGFDVKDYEPIDPKQPWGGLRVSKWELLECSFVSVPADTGAVVTARELHREGADWKCGAARDLPIEDSDDWDGGAAAASIFAYAGGDDFDPGKARRGFLFYDAAKPKERGSYKDPIAHDVGGELKVPKGAIRAAASRLPQTDVPAAVKEAGQAVLDHYKKAAGIGDDDGRSVRPMRRRRRERTETMSNARAGKILSALNAAKLEEADTHHREALAHHERAVDAHDAMKERCRSLDGAMDNCRSLHGKIGDALRAGDVEMAMAHHAEMQRGLDAVDDCVDGYGDDDDDMESAHRGLKRCLRAASDCVRAVVPGSPDSQTIQTSGGTGTSAGSENGRSFAERQAEKKALKLVA